MGVIVIMAGDRNWTDEWAPRLVLLGLRVQYGKALHVVQGGAPGLDTVVRNLCSRLRIKQRTFKADWNQNGPSAGPIRNREMLQWCQQNRMHELVLCMGFHDEIFGKTPRGNKRGTKDMLDIAAAAGVPTKLVTGWPWPST